MSRMPNWLKALLIVLAVLFLGPPLLVMGLAALGIAIGLSFKLFKLAAIGLGIFAIVMLFKTILSKPTVSRSSFDPKLKLQVDAMAAQKKALDEELDRVLADARKSTT